MVSNGLGYMPITRHTYRCGVRHVRRHRWVYTLCCASLGDARHISPYDSGTAALIDDVDQHGNPCWSPVFDRYIRCENDAGGRTVAKSTVNCKTCDFTLALQAQAVLKHVLRVYPQSFTRMLGSAAPAGANFHLQADQSRSAKNINPRSNNMYRQFYPICCLLGGRLQGRSAGMVSTLHARTALPA